MLRMVVSVFIIAMATPARGIATRLQARSLIIARSRVSLKNPTSKPLQVLGLILTFLAIVIDDCAI